MKRLLGLIPAAFAVPVGILTWTCFSDIFAPRELLFEIAGDMFFGLLCLTIETFLIFCAVSLFTAVWWKEAQK